VKYYTEGWFDALDALQLTFIKKLNSYKKEDKITLNKFLKHL